MNGAMIIDDSAFVPFSYIAKGLGNIGLTPAASRRVKPMPANIKGMVPPPTDNNITTKPGVPDVEKDTMPLIISKAKRTAYQVKKLANYLKGLSLAETLRNDSNFILDYIKYKLDDKNSEQIRSPRRLIYEGAGDCDCFATCLATLLINQGVTFKFRIAKYNKGSEWSHIYIVVPKDQSYTGALNDRNDYIVLDPVTNKHNYEVPVIQKRDYDMSLQFLDGLGCNCGVPANDKLPDGPARIYTRYTKGIKTSQREDSKKLLDSLGLPYVQSKDEQGRPIYNVTTPTGIKTVGTFLPIEPEKQDAIKTELLKPAETTTAVAVADTNKNLTPDEKKKATGILIALALTVVALNSLRGDKPTTQTMGRVPVAKKLPIVQL